MDTFGPSWPPVATEPPAAHPDSPAAGTELGVHYAECFGCGDQIDGGLHLRSTVGENHVVHSQLVVTDTHQGAPGLAHGGLLACAFDEALGAATGNFLRQPVVTGKLEVDFLRPVPVGTTLYITAELNGVANRKVYASADGRLNRTDGSVAVRARALFVKVDLAHFTTHGDPRAIEKLRNSGHPTTRPDWDINP